MTKLTSKQEKFCLEYLKDLNATQAAIRAGYSQKTAKDIGCQNLAKVYLAERIAELKETAAKKVLCDIDFVINGLREEALGKSEDSTSSARVAAYKHLGEYTGGFDANKQKIDISGSVDMSDRLQRAKERARES